MSRTNAADDTLTTVQIGAISLMKAREVLERMRRHGCRVIRQKGAHARVVSSCGECVTTLAMHGGDMAPGTLRSIEKDMEPCLGVGWCDEEIPRRDQESWDWVACGNRRGARAPHREVDAWRGARVPPGSVRDARFRRRCGAQRDQETRGG